MSHIHVHVQAQRVGVGLYRITMNYPDGTADTATMNVADIERMYQFECDRWIPIWQRRRRKIQPVLLRIYRQLHDMAVANEAALFFDERGADG